MEKSTSLGAPQVVPGKGIGPLQVGMTREEVSRLGLSLKPHPSGQMGPGVLLVGPYYVVFREDRVTSIAFTLTGSPAGLLWGDKVLPPSASLEQVEATLPGCGQIQLVEGGAQLQCGPDTLVKRGADNVVEVQVGE